MKLFEYTGEEILVQYHPASGRVRIGTEIYGYSLTLIMARVAAATKDASITFAELGVAMRVVCNEFPRVHRRGTEQEAHLVRAPR